MANEKRLIDANALKRLTCEWCNKTRPEEPCEPSECSIMQFYDGQPTVDSVEVEKYKTLAEMYHDLRENFVDYYCSGVQNVAPYCLNRCEECVDKWGYCKQYSDYCKGFNPAEVILKDAKMDGDGNDI